MDTRKRFWRCNVCNDIHYGVKPPKVCPTCGMVNAFVQCDANEAMKVMEDDASSIAAVEDLIAVWNEWLTRNEAIKLWEDPESVRLLATGELENDNNQGLKYCPCRATTGDRQKDLKLICPCNFYVQQTWKEYGECWCGLFVKR
jgi:ferredoxin-thioredoxin reductase catalytic chain